jgi:hypothetical protein
MVNVLTEIEIICSRNKVSEYVINLRAINNYAADFKQLRFD